MENIFDLTEREGCTLDETLLIKAKTPSAGVNGALLPAEALLLLGFSVSVVLGEQTSVSHSSASILPLSSY